MRQVYRVSADGFFLEDVRLQDGVAVPNDCVRQQAPQGFNWPKWEGTRGEDSQGVWVEGGGIWHRQPDGRVDPTKRHSEVTAVDGSKLRRDVAGRLLRNGVVVPENR